jgi:hypothetical protein
MSRTGDGDRDKLLLLTGLLLADFSRGGEVAGGGDLDGDLQNVPKAKKLLLSKGILQQFDQNMCEYGNINTHEIESNKQ